MSGLARREFLKLTVSLITGASVGLPGCVSKQLQSIDILYAGSLQKEMEEVLCPEFEKSSGITCYTDVKTSVTLLSMVKDGIRNPDVVISADANLLKEFLFPDIANWYAIFASNSMVIAWAKKPDNTYDEWFNTIIENEMSMGISDPKIDPLGYRSLLTLKLADIYYNFPVYDSISDQIIIFGTEMDLMANLETGNVDSAMIYRNMAISHKIPFTNLPDEINLSSVKFANTYSKVKIMVKEREYIGGPILYALTVPKKAPNPQGAMKFVKFLFNEGLALFNELGLLTNNMPILKGDVPGGLYEPE